MILFEIKINFVNRISMDLVFDTYDTAPILNLEPDSVFTTEIAPGVKFTGGGYTEFILTKTLSDHVITYAIRNIELHEEASGMQTFKGKIKSMNSNKNLSTKGCGYRNKIVKFVHTQIKDVFHVQY